MPKLKKKAIKKCQKLINILKYQHEFFWNFPMQETISKKSVLKPLSKIIKKTRDKLTGVQTAVILYSECKIKLTERCR